MRLAFTLSKAERLFLIIRGPAPSCEVVGVIALRGHKGINKVNFAGRAKGRNLRPGGYLLSLSRVRQPSADAPTTFVHVVSKRRSVPAKAGSKKPTCADERAFTAGPGFRLLRREGPTTGLPAAKANASVPPARSDQQDDVLGVASPLPGFDSGSAAEGLETLFRIGILALIGAILLTAGTLVTRFFRGTWNP